VGRQQGFGLTSEFVLELGLFDVHVLKFTGLEDFRAFQAFDKFGVFIAGNDPHTRMLALAHVAPLLGGWGRRD
jgi:hypothetical protein